MCNQRKDKASAGAKVKSKNEQQACSRSVRSLAVASAEESIRRSKCVGPLRTTSRTALANNAANSAPRRGCSIVGNVHAPAISSAALSLASVSITATLTERMVLLSIATRQISPVDARAVAVLAVGRLRPVANPQISASAASGRAPSSPVCGRRVKAVGGSRQSARPPASAPGPPSPAATIARHTRSGVHGMAMWRTPR